VRAIGATDVLEWAKNDLDGFFDTHPNIHRCLLENLTKITAHRIRRLDETLIQSVYDSIIWLDGQCRIRRWNRLTDRRFLFDQRDPSETPTEQDLFKRVPQLGEGLRQKLLQIMASDQTAVLPLEYEDGGSMAYFDITVAPQHDGAILGIRDVTDFKTQELRLIQAEKLAMAGQMSAEIGHELKNYLTVMMGHVELLQINPNIGQDARILRSLTALGEQLTRVERFASGLMDLGMLRSKTERASLNMLIEKLLPFIQGQSRFRRVEFVLDLDRQLPLVHIDQGQIQQVLINLYANAADAMGKGTIATTTRFDEVNHKVMITVVDYGPGMPEPILKRIFDSGFTTKKTGHGFGLAICARIVENHGGKIDVKSEVGVGTTFTLTFPMT
jgi:signal transduction histidine kinase